MKWLLILFSMFSLSVLGADVTGTWKGTAETPNGTIERTFVFKVDGKKLTGETTSQLLGKSTINDGIIDGDDLSFTISAKFQDNEVKLVYKGKVSGDQIKLHVESQDGAISADYVAKRVQ